MAFLNAFHQYFKDHIDAFIQGRQQKEGEKMGMIMDLLFTLFCDDLPDPNNKPLLQINTPCDEEFYKTRYLTLMKTVATILPARTEALSVMTCQEHKNQRTIEERVRMAAPTNTKEAQEMWTQYVLKPKPFQKGQPDRKRLKAEQGTSDSDENRT